jgi:hypothetical protein
VGAARRSHGTARAEHPTLQPHPSTAFDSGCLQIFFLRVRDPDGGFRDSLGGAYPEFPSRYGRRRVLNRRICICIVAASLAAGSLCHAAVTGDFDLDGDVDTADLDIFSACRLGPDRLNDSPASRSQDFRSR